MGSCTYPFSKSCVCFKFSGGKIHKGLRKMFRHFCRTLVVVKSSELTRPRRKGRREKTQEWRRGRSSTGFCFFVLAMKSKSQGPKGRKVQNQARKMDKENQGRVVGDGQGRTDVRWAQGGCACGLPRGQNATLGTRSVTERALAGGRQRSVNITEENTSRH